MSNSIARSTYFWPKGRLGSHVRRSGGLARKPVILASSVACALRVVWDSRWPPPRNIRWRGRMIEHSAGFSDNILAFVYRGHVTRADYETVLVPVVARAL